MHSPIRSEHNPTASARNIGPFDVSFSSPPTKNSQSEFLYPISSEISTPDSGHHQLQISPNRFQRNFILHEGTLSPSAFQLPKLFESVSDCRHDGPERLSISSGNPERVAPKSQELHTNTHYTKLNLKMIDTKASNLAFAAIILEKFCQELAALCLEHSLLVGSLHGSP
ncbi:unnamed protein product [Protopolystoma xenopodis]|uniref:Uncharacterized protein n=1 Tax=Protopolystoma xenopodis TaxID=117903 RepID=A0A448X170_9PLAT|nr:unnamed protein product [Protopolystoma xenopodis]